MEKPAKVIGWTVAIVSVASGLVAIAAYLSIGPQELAAYGRQAAVAAWSAVIAVLTFGVPVWTIIAILVAGVGVLWLLARSQPEPSRVKLPSRPDPTEAYLADSMFGVEWVWRWSFTGPDALTALCPTCKNELGGPNGRMFHCSYCRKGYETDLWDSRHGYVQEVEKEIRRRCRTGEWMEAPQRLKNPAIGPAGPT